MITDVELDVVNDDVIVPSPCGRPTTRGKPCRIPRGTGSACSLHLTPEEQHFDPRREDWKEGWAAGYRGGHEDGLRAAELKRKETERTRNRRHTTENGNQIVGCGNYAYAWDGDEALSVGDDVILPDNWLHAGTRIATVTELGTDYDGDLATIIGRASSE